MPDSTEWYEMHKTQKLEEAQYFCTQLINAQDDLSSADIFRYNLSAFLSAARSIAQYACDEARQKSGGQDWYDKAVASCNVVGFFKKKRDDNIHREPVRVQNDIGVQLFETLQFSESLSMVVMDAEGNIKETRTADSEVPSPASYLSPLQSPVVTYRYRFDDWPGPEEVAQLCRLYLTELEALVGDGRTRGWLT